MKDIIVLKRFPYQGSYREVGSVHSVPERFAKLMISIRKADPYVEPPKPVDPPKPKRTYKRKDMEAEQYNSKGTESE